MPGMPARRYRGREDDEAQGSSRTFGPIVRIILGLIIAIDTSLLAAPLYYGTVSPCDMVALSRASLHAQAADDEIGIDDEVSLDVFYASSVWVRRQEGIASCAGSIGGRTISALLP